MVQKCWTSLAVLLIFFSLYPARNVLRKVQNQPDKEFTFSLGQYAYDGEIFYVGAHGQMPDNDFDKSFALAAAKRDTLFSSFAPKEVEVDGVSTGTSPLHGASVEILKLSGKVPLVVTKEFPSDIYAVLNATQPDKAGTRIVSAKSINDASGLPTAGIIGLTTVSTNAGTYFIAAVKKNEGNFGDVGSGLALIKFETFTPDPLDATTGAVLGNKAAPLDCQHPAIKINNPVTVNSNVVDMCFDSELERLYLVLDVTSGSESTDGARAVVMGKIDKNILTLHPIAPDSIFDAPDKIIGGSGSHCRTSLYKVRTIETSSKIRYLVVASSQPQGNYVYTLPLVDLSSVNQMNPTADLSHGTLANVNAAPVDSFHNTALPNLRARGMVDAAVHPTDAFSNSSPQAIVGGGPVPLEADQRITDIFARNDAIFVSIGGPLSPVNQPGIFHSQAILDNVGRIVSWSPWQRAYGTQEQVFGMVMDERTHCMWMMTGTSTDFIDKVKITQWSTTKLNEKDKKYSLLTDSNGLLGGTLTDTHVGFTYQIAKELPRKRGGVHNFFVFNEHTPSFGHNASTINNQLSLLVATGLGKVVLVETGRNNTEHIFTPNMGDFATGKQKFRDGTLQGLQTNPQTKIITVSGGAVAALGPIIAAEVSRAPLCDGTRQGYLFIGGAHGLAVLCDDSLRGWDTSLNEGLHASFSSLTPDMSFKKIGSFSQVRKLWSDEYYLYVLTNHALDRIKLSSIAHGSLEIIRLADYESLGLPSFTIFYDMGISYKLGLLATSAGLFRVGNDKDISDFSIMNGHDLKWTQVTIPEGHAPVCQLYFVSSTLDENGFAGPGMMYVLSSAYNQSRVNRFFIKDVRNCPITDSTITPLNDFFLKGIHSYLVEFGLYKNFIATDGYALLNARTGSQEMGSHVDMYGNFKAGKKYKITHENFVLLAIENSDAKHHRLFSHQGIRHMLRNSSGSWLIGGDFGLRVNE